MPSGKKNIEIGTEEAPSFSITNQTENELKQLISGKSILLNFWNPNDPESRIRNKQLSDLLISLPDEKICLVSVCTSDDNNLSNEIMNNDGIHKMNAVNICLNDLDDSVFNDYQVNLGNRSFLIDSEGILKFIMPTSADIINYLNS